MSSQTHSLLLRLSAALLLGLGVLSVVGAFAGPERTARFVNSPAAVALWIGLSILLLAAILSRRPSLRRAGVIALHAGCLLVLAGSMRQSAAGHRGVGRFFGKDRPRDGFVALREGESTRSVLDSTLSGEIGRLDFDLKLDRFAIDYYPPRALSRGPYKPAPEVRSYRSSLTVLKDGEADVRAVVFVNGPLHYGGYHFYQYSYGLDPAPYTVLRVISDAGMPAVALGFLLLAGGAAGVFWSRRALNDSGGGGDVA